MEGMLTALAAWLAGFYALLALYHSRPSVFRRLGIEANPFAIILRKGYAFDFVDRLPGGTRKALRIFYTAGVAALALTALLFYHIIVGVTLARLARATTAPALVPLIPGVTVSLGFFLELLPALGLAALVHELSHGIAARLEGIPVKSTGIMLILGLIPAAFVEPLEEAFRKARLASKLRVLGAGVTANLVLAAMALALLALLPAQPLLVVEGFPEHSPARQAGIEKGDIIVYVNGTRVSSVETLHRIIAESNAVNITVERSGKLVSFIVPVASENGKRYIGVYISIRLPPLHRFLALLHFVNLSLALINAAPLFITDGGRALHETLSTLGRGGTALSMTLQATTLLLVLANTAITRIG